MIDDARPIWVQLVDDFRHRVVTGAWESGARIPSVRDLATDLGVNPNTVQRALGELDRTGITVTERTAGRFVTRDEELLRGLRADLATQATEEYLRTVQSLGIDRAAVDELIARRWNQGEEQ